MCYTHDMPCAKRKDTHKPRHNLSPACTLRTAYSITTCKQLYAVLKVQAGHKECWQPKWLSLCTTSDLTINSHEQQSLWLYNLEQLVQVGENLDNHFVLGEFRAWVVAVCAVMYDTIHV